VDIAARGGNLLLNVGPTGAGHIPWRQAQRLLALGHWLRTNGEAIYQTRPWDRSSGVNDEGIRIRYTCTDDSVYAVVLGTPRTASVELDVQLAEGATVELLGWGGSLPWRATPHGTRVELPDRPVVRPVMTLRISPGSAASAG
jgi:alpha-L-fucosidase